MANNTNNPKNLETIKQNEDDPLIEAVGL